jgi:bifunctional N-acetylglucosamine-1-phosphate-uridyltransferase/glucosamine-1-phosphate-acetyltransferase GlmU-like protein
VSRRVLVIPAAGRGARLGASSPKVLVPVNGRAMLAHLVDLYRPFVRHVVVVASPAGAQAIDAALRAWGTPATLAIQAEPTGMLDAIGIGLAAMPPASFDRAWITWGDQVAVLPETLERLAAAEAAADVALPTVARDAPYIHFARDDDDRIVRVLQRREGDEMPARGENDMGVFSLSRRAAGEWLPEYAREAEPGAGTGERNFLPFVAWAAARGAVATCPCTDPVEAVGINTPAELEFVERILRAR